MATYAIETLLRGGHVRYGTFDASLRGPGVPVPIYVAASGPKTMKMAAAVGDAVIVTLGDIEAKLTTIREAAKDAGVEVPKVFVYTTCAVTDDLERTSRLFKPSCIRVAQLEGVAMFERAGVRVTPPAHVAGAEGDVGHAEDIAAAAQSLDSLVSDEAAVWFAQNRAIVGDAAEVHERFAWLQHVGVAGVTLNQLTGSDLPDALIDAVGPIIRSG